MPQITSRARYYFGLHGWPESDITYLEENADSIEDHDGWAMAKARASDGVLWLYPASEADTYPLSLWREIARLIKSEDNVIIPMNKNMDKVANATKRYNGYLLDNVLLFGDELKGLKEFPGESIWRG